MTDDAIHVNPRGGFRTRASDARALTKATGRTLGELLAGEDMADQLQAFAFIELRRRERDAQPHPDRGEFIYRDPAETWELAGETDVEMDGDTIPTPDPLGVPSF